MARYYYSAIPAFEVPPSAFAPALKVNSAVVHLAPHTAMPYPVKDVHTLSCITTEAPSQYRKTVCNSLGSLFSVGVLTELDIDPTVRAKNISVA